jgi:hypothetical protein
LTAMKTRRNSRRMNWIGITTERHEHWKVRNSFATI